MAGTQGTAIGEAVDLARRSITDTEKAQRALIIITDGEDHDEQAIKTAKQLAANGVVIYTIGVGSTPGAPILNPITGESRRDLHGNVVISRLNEQELTDIAHAANGIYQQLNDTETVVNKITAAFAGMEQKTIQDNRLLNYRSFFQWFLVLAFAGLTGELFISEKKKIR